MPVVLYACKILACGAASNGNDCAYVPCLLVVEVAGVATSPPPEVHAVSQSSIVVVCAVVSVTVLERFVHAAVQPKEAGAGLLAILMVSPGAIRAKVAPKVIVFHGCPAANESPAFPSSQFS